MRGGEAHRAEVDRARPSPGRRRGDADRDLGRGAADVADGDRPRQLHVRGGDGAAVREPAFLLGREHAHGTPAARASAATSCSALPLCRPGAVTKTSSDSTPCCRATAAELRRPPSPRRRCCTSETTPSRSISSPSERRTRSLVEPAATSPRSSAATSRRIVFEPTSMTPMRIGAHGRSAVGGRRQRARERAVTTW